MRKFKMVIEVEDDEANAEESLAEIKHIYNTAVLANTGYEINFNVLHVEEMSVKKEQEEV